MRASSRPRSEAMRARSTSSRAAISDFLQRLHAGDLELLHGPPAFEPGKLDGLLAHDVGALDVLGGDDIGFLHPTIGVCALGELGRDFDRTVLIGDLDDLAPFGVEYLARLR